ncbi:NAD(P)-binding domain-containing protein [Gordonia sp. SID5947]|uniref:flavin-containing monooxygenase n=1 Tax=Gordonia sp. SID5947 TaxID=2690315 RepID=UPI001367BDAE|nr:NAD(P)/FAD-dependent oxidoreductase [Gordonia sp. SID5947]MYR08172.1 NAD(P)-binding domain-containing protein [Gordonia sp. SID5947]
MANESDNGARDTDAAADPDLTVAIVGAGFSGIGTAIRLEQAGIHDWEIFEAGGGAGGTWYWNTYPGVAVDIPSFSYQFSFAPGEWSRSYAPGVELRRYADDMVERYRLTDRIRFHTQVASADFDTDQHRWRLTLAGGETVTARFLINAAGPLNVPALPDIAGVAEFSGITMHTARWDHTVDLRGRRVGIIGTGASAVQVIPAIAGEVGSLTVFQRTPIWCMPKMDFALPRNIRLLSRRPILRMLPRAVSQSYVEFTFTISAQFYKWLPVVRIAERNCRRWLRSQVDDPETRAKLTPAYALGCKRPGFHNEYLATYNRENVTLETTPIEAVTPMGVRCSDGTEHDLDILILATGFKVMDPDNMPTFRLTGPDGTTMSDFWREHRLQAYEGVSVPGFPNFFFVFGPYGYTGSSYFALVENQTRHIVRCLRAAGERGATRIEVRQEANDRYFESMLRRRYRQVFWNDSCRTAHSYYFDKNGDVPLRPTTTAEAGLRSRLYPLEDYEFTGSSAAGNP